MSRHLCAELIPQITNPMMSEEKLINLYHLVQRVLVTHTEGDLVELGCHEGVAALLIQKILDQSGSNKTLHLYDSFRGLPEKSIEDGETPYQKGWLKAFRDRLIARFEKYGATLPTIHEGWFSEILPNRLPEVISFAHLDGDFYSSILESLAAVYPRLSRGAIVLIDDYCDPSVLDRFNKLPGVKKACDEFFKEKLEKIEILLCGKHAQGYFVKL